MDRKIIEIARRELTEEAKREKIEVAKRIIVQIDILKGQLAKLEQQLDEV